MLKRKDRNRKFSSFEIEKRLKIKRVTLQDWLSRGFIEPHTKADGRGSKNQFSIWNLYQIELFRYLINHGLSRKEASERSKKFHPGNIAAELVEKLQRAKKEGNKQLYDSQLDFPFLMITRKNNDYSAKFVFGGEVLRIDDYAKYDEVHLVNLGTIMEQVDRAF